MAVCTPLHTSIHMYARFHMSIVNSFCHVKKKKVRNEVKELREFSVSDRLWIHFTPVCIGTVNNPVFSCISKLVSSFVLDYMCSVVC